MLIIVIFSIVKKLIYLTTTEFVMPSSTALKENICYLFQSIHSAQLTRNNLLAITTAFYLFWYIKAYLSVCIKYLISFYIYFNNSRFCFVFYLRKLSLYVKMAPTCNN